METSLAVRRLSALAQESRLSVFRLLVGAGPAGLPAGVVARELGLAPNTLSAQLSVLANAGLVAARREGRSVIYRAEYEAVKGLILHLMEDCCAGRREICGPVAEAARWCVEKQAEARP